MALREKLQQEKDDAVSAELNPKIAELKAEKEELIRLLPQIKSRYSEAVTSLEDFGVKSGEISDVYEDFAEDLSKKGIEDRADFIKSDEYSEEEEIVNYKEAGKKLRESVKEVASTKKELKAKMPDLDFKGGRDEESGVSSREESIVKIEERIKELSSQIEELEKLTPEHEEERKKIDECTAELVGTVEWFKISDRVQDAGIDRADLMPYHFSKYLTKYGEEVLKKVIKEATDNGVDRFIEKTLKKNAGIGRPYDAEGEKLKLEKLVSLKIDNDFDKRKLEELSLNPIFSSVKQKIESIEKNKKIIEFGVEEVTRLRLNLSDSMDRLVDVNVGGSFRGKNFEGKVEYSYDDITKRIDSLRDEIVKTDKEVDSLMAGLKKTAGEKPSFFGKKAHADTILRFEHSISEGRAQIGLLKQKVEKEESQGKSPSSLAVTKELRDLIVKTGLDDEISGFNLPIKQVLEKVEEKLNALPVEASEDEYVLYDSFKVQTAKVSESEFRYTTAVNSIS